MLFRSELEAYGHGLDEKPEIVALNKVDAIPENELAKRRAALEKACGHKVHVISGVSGEGINTVLRAMAHQINQRRLRRAEEAEYGRPAPVPRTRADRQAVNFKAPVVPKAKLTDEIRAKSVTPKAAVPARKVAAPVPKPKAKPKATSRRAKGNAKVKIVPVKKKARGSIGKAKARPKALSKTGKRAQKSGRR